MTPNQLRKLERELDEWLTRLFEGMGRRERREALGAYLRGLLLEGERKSIEPIAERLTSVPSDVQGMRQRLQQAVTVADWDEETLYKRIAQQAERVLPELDAFVLDDTGFPKKGFKSVGVQRQYSGTMGRIDNCQVATSLHLASEHGGVCIGMRLYLPKDWAADPKRRARTGIPEHIQFEEKWKIGLRLLDAARSWGLSDRVIVADAGYGDCIEFREELAKRGMGFVIGITGTAVAWPPGVMPTPPGKRVRASGRAPSRWHDPDNGTALPMSEIAANLTSKSWRTITWREGTRGPQKSRFAAIRIRTAHRHALGAPPSEEMWLLCEWPRRQDQPSKLYVSNLPEKTSLKKLVYLAKLRWRIERDYQEMKGELGLDHFEGRGWRGFHHHVACVAASHAFLAFQRVRFPPEDRKAHAARVPPRVAASPPAPHRNLSALPSGGRAAGATMTGRM